jgi:hypothetical protein
MTWVPCVTVGELLNAARWGSTQRAAFGFKIVFFLGIRIVGLTRGCSRRRGTSATPLFGRFNADQNPTTDEHLIRAVTVSFHVVVGGAAEAVRAQNSGTV